MNFSAVLRCACVVLLVVATAGSAPRKSAAKKEKFDQKMLRLQVWLDRENFGPGKIDGKGGEFTTKALAFYKEAHPETSVAAEAPADFQEPEVVEYVIGEKDGDRVGEVPSDKAQQSRLKSLPYRSLLDFVAERFHADPALMRVLNPGTKWETLKPGDVVKVPNVIPFEIEKIDPEHKLKVDSGLQSRSVRIDPKEKSLKLFQEEKLLAAFPITPGSERLPAPSGTWKIESIVLLPVFRWDPKMLNEGVRGPEGINLPPGPRNPVGVLWMQLNKKGIGIHGTNDPARIGRTESHGCIRLANWDAAKLSRLVTAGVGVEIK